MQTVHLFGKINTDDADKDLPNDQVRSIRNLLPSKRSNGLRRELVRGNSKLSGSASFFQTLEDSSEFFTLDNIEVIGSFASTDDDVLYVFYKNPNYIVKIEVDASGNNQYSYVPYENRFIWNFDNLSYVHNISVIGDKLHWCQENGEQYLLNINKDYLGSINTFDNYTDSQLDQRKLLYLQKVSPVFPIKVKPINTGADDDRKNREFLEDKSLMFAYRFVYETGDVSTFSPWSECQPAFSVKKRALYRAGTSQASVDQAQRAQDNYNLNPRYYELNIDKKNIPMTVTSIEFASIDQNESFSIFKRLNVDVATLTNYTGNENIIVEYTGNEIKEPVSLGESLKIQQPNPFNPKTSILFDDRVFQAGGQVGRDYDGSVSLSITKLLVGNTASTYTQDGLTKLWSRRPLFKSGGLYKIGVQFLDEDFKRSFVQAETNYRLSDENVTSFDRARLLVKGSGAVPSWAKYFQYVRSDVINYDVYFTTNTIALKYISELAEGATVDEEKEYAWQDRIYRAENLPNVDDYNYLHLLMPRNLPFQLDNSYKIRFLNVTSLEESEFPILDVIGNIAVIDKIDFADFPIVLNGNAFQVFVFKENLNEDVEILHETGDVYPIDDWGTSLEISGDTYIIDSENGNGASLVFDDFNPSQDGSNYADILNPIIEANSSDFITSSQTTTLRQGSSNVTTIETSPETEEEFAPETIFGFFGPILNAVGIKNDIGVNSKVTSRIVQNYAKLVANYDLAISSKGRPNVSYKNEKRTTLSNRIYFSDPFIQGTKINGLSNFQGNNVYDLPSERGPIVTLVPIHSSQVVLALHPRRTTSLYIGEGFIRQGDGSILAKTESVIGDDRPLRGEYGTTNPESVTVWDGTAIWWDQNQREIVRYNNNGLTPLGLVYKNRDYLNSWGEALSQDNSSKVITGYDPYYESFIIKFPTIGEKQGETLYFSNIPGQEGFNAIVDHEAESFTTIQDELISFNNKEAYTASGGNTFYGNQNIDKSVEFIHNEQPMVTKIYENMSINSDKPWITEISNVRGQETDMIESDFRLYEDTYYSEVLRDKNTPDDLMKEGQIKLRDGNLIKGQYANVKISSNEATDLNEVVIGSQVAGGQYLMD